jgi:hypothetical protein
MPLAGRAIQNAPTNFEVAAPPRSECRESAALRLSFAAGEAASEAPGLEQSAADLLERNVN